MRWKITIEGINDVGGGDCAEIVVEKEFNNLSNGEIGLTISDGKAIMACLQQLKQQCEAYVLSRRYCWIARPSALSRTIAGLRSERSLDA